MSLTYREPNQVQSMPGGCYTPGNAPALPAPPVVRYVAPAPAPPPPPPSTAELNRLREEAKSRALWDCVFGVGETAPEKSRFSFDEYAEALAGKKVRVSPGDEEKEKDGHANYRLSPRLLPVPPRVRPGG
jgi:hypothetical protein